MEGATCSISIIFIKEEKGKGKNAEEKF